MNVEKVVSTEEENKPLIWINPKVFMLEQEIEKLKSDIDIYKFTIRTLNEQIDELIQKLEEDKE